MKRLAAIFLAVILEPSLSASAWAQDPPIAHQHPPDAQASAGWTWSADGNLFFGYNYQARQFLDESAWESQNWLMGAGERSLARGRFTVHAMLSLEPFTMRAKGSPQLFQTGETYQQASLVNFQHPHDLLMGLGGTFRWPHARGAYFVGADLVGSPTLGPRPFMHRESARGNPQVPLMHHLLDSTHSTPGVIRGGVEIGPFVLESSVFRGAEPDEDRVDIERPRLDSWAARLQFSRGPWHAQVSGGHLEEPEFIEPFDVTRITASLSFDGVVRDRPVRLTMAWGTNREFNGFNGNHDGYLAEWDVQPWRASSIYGRAELVDKEPFAATRHPPGLQHPHFYYKVGAFTSGYVYERTATGLGRVGIGVDATVYRMPDLFKQFWGGSRSYHVFVRWRPNGSAAHVH